MNGLQVRLIVLLFALLLALVAGQNFYFGSAPTEKAAAGASCDPQEQSCAAAAVEGELSAPVPLSHSVYRDGCASDGDLHVVAYSVDDSGEPLVATFCD